jgi:hypothetical protein
LTRNGSPRNSALAAVFRRLRHRRPDNDQARLKIFNSELISAARDRKVFSDQRRRG